MGSSNSKNLPPLHWASSTAPCSDRNITWQYLHTRGNLSPPYTDCPNLVDALDRWSCEHGHCQPAKYLDEFQSWILYIFPTEFIKYARPKGTWDGLGNPLVGRWEDGVWQVVSVGEDGEWEWERIGSWQDGDWKWVGENDWQKGWWQKGWWEVTTITGTATARPVIKGNGTNLLGRRNVMRSAYRAGSESVHARIQPYSSNDKVSASVLAQASKPELSDQSGISAEIVALLIIALLFTLGFNFWCKRKGRKQRTKGKKDHAAELAPDLGV